MSGLFGSLNNSVKGLSAQQRGVETAGRNLANVNNTSYARQRVLFGDRGTVQTVYGPQSLGIEALGVQNIRDSLLDQQVIREISLTSQLTTSQSALQKAQAGLGQSITSATSSTSTDSSSTGGIASSLGELFTAFESLAATPTDTGERQTLLQKAEILVDNFNLTDSRLEQAQGDMTALVKSDVSAINAILQTIGSLNIQITRLENGTAGTASELRDSRQAQLEQLGKYLSFETRAQPGVEGQIQVYSRDGSGGEVLLVSLAASATLTTDAGATAITATNIPGSPTATATLSITSGSIKGALDARDSTIQNLRDELDTLANQIVVSVNDAYNPGGTGRDFFVAAGTTAATIQRNTTVTVANLEPDQTSAAAGDSTIPAAVANLASHVFSLAGGDLIDGTLSQYYTNSVSNLGQELAGINSRLIDQATIENLVRTQRDSVSGVSLDEEMADLMKYQRAFQASSRVIAAIDEMLNTVINDMG